mgnify:CR=1 FL=1
MACNTANKHESRVDIHSYIKAYTQAHKPHTTYTHTHTNLRMRKCADKQAGGKDISKYPRRGGDDPTDGLKIIKGS